MTRNGLEKTQKTRLFEHFFDTFLGVDPSTSSHVIHFLMRVTFQVKNVCNSEQKNTKKAVGGVRGGYIGKKLTGFELKKYRF
jgi:hypothetical protein